MRIFFYSILIVFSLYVGCSALQSDANHKKQNTCKSCKIEVWGMNWNAHYFVAGNKQSVVRNDNYVGAWQEKGLCRDFLLLLEGMQKVATIELYDIRVAVKINKDTLWIAKNNMVQFQGQYYDNGDCLSYKIGKLLRCDSLSSNRFYPIDHSMPCD